MCYTHEEQTKRHRFDYARTPVAKRLETRFNITWFPVLHYLRLFLMAAEQILMITEFCVADQKKNQLRRFFCVAATHH